MSLITPRFHCPLPLAVGQELSLPEGAARHVQVLRLQPGDSLRLFTGDGGEFAATVLHMGRSEVRVSIGEHHAIERELARAVHLVVGMPANERMDWLVEKATELGVASIQPVLAARTVLKLQGERAEKKRQPWQGIAVAACQQSGRNRVPSVLPALNFSDWSRSDQATPAVGGSAWVLSLRDQAQTLAPAQWPSGPLTLLSGPEGGLSPAEEDAAVELGWRPLNLGPRTLRSETAPLAVLAAVALGP